MKTIIGSKIEVQQYSQEVLDFAEKELVFNNPKYYLLKKTHRSVWGVPEKIVLYEKIGGSLFLPFGVLKKVFPLIKDSPIEAHFDKYQTKQLLPRTILRDYQITALDKLVSGKNGILVSPCGSGKTMVGMHLISKLKRRTLWVAHTTDLVNQAKQCAEREFINLEENDIGTIMDGKVNVGNIITFATIQTLALIDLSTLKDYFGCIIIDECAHLSGTPTTITMYYKVLSRLNARYKYGLTATPKRIDGLTPCMYALVGDKLHEITDYDVNKIKCNAKLIEIDLPTSDNLSYYDSDFKFIQYKFDTYIATNDERNARIVNNIINVYLENNKHIQLVLCNRVEQVERLAKMLKESELDLKVGTFVGKTKKSTRVDILTNYKSYNVIVATYSIASEGIDMPSLDTLHLASPKTKNNKSLLTQCIGRIERASPDKERAVVYVYKDFNIPFSIQCAKRVRLAMGQKTIIFN